VNPPLHILRTTNGYVVVLIAFDPSQGELRFDFLHPFDREKHPADWREYENWRDKLIDHFLK
jgi:hypothetical protein